MSKKNTYAVEVSFPNNRGPRYHYWTDIPNLMPNDVCVVQVNREYKTVIVTRILHEGSERANKWIVDKVNVSAHKKRQAKLEIANLEAQAMAIQERLMRARLRVGV